MSATAAWHQDPWDPARLRWWDGTAWTGWTSPDAPGPASSSSPAPSAELPPPGWHPDPWDPSRFRWWDGAAWTADQVVAHAPERPWGAGTLMSSPSFGAEVLFKFRGAAAGLEPDRLAAAARAPRPGAPEAALAVVAAAVCASLWFGVRLPDAAPPGLVLGAVGLWAVATAVAVHAVRRWARLADLPTSAPVAAHVGTCELTGDLRPLGVLQRSWLADRECLWWGAAAEFASDGDWKSTFGQAAAAPAALGDGDGGEVVVDLAEWASFLPGCAAVFQARDGKVRCTEYVVAPGATVTLVGEVALAADGRLQVRPAPGSSLVLGAPPGAERAAAGRAGAAVAGALAAWCVLAVAAGVPAAVLAVPAVVPAAWAWWSRARLVAVRERIAGSWAVVGTFAQRRHDLVPQLAAVAAGAAAHELSVQVAAAEVPSAAEASGVDALLAGDDPGAAVVRATVEARPDLHADAAFAALFRELVHCEAQLAGARTTYNDAVRIAADRRGTFPTSLLARGVLPVVPPYLRWGRPG